MMPMGDAAMLHRLHTSARCRHYHYYFSFSFSLRDISLSGALLSFAFSFINRLFSRQADIKQPRLLEIYRLPLRHDMIDD